MNEIAEHTGRVLIVDDESNVHRAITRLLRGNGFELFTAESGLDALSILEQNLIDVVLLDIRLPDINGIEVLRHVKRIDADTVVVMMTGHGTVKTAVEAMKEGAFEFLTKPFESNDLIPLAVERALQYRRVHEQNRKLQGVISGQLELNNFIGSSAPIERLRKMATRLADIDSTVLVTGETGTGKEVLARAIHFNGARRKSRFVPVDCGAIPAGVIESELFGHMKGAFTGASNANEGLIRQADKGTLFLDEIGELPLDMQTRLLRFLQEREVRPVGGGNPASVDVRVIAATNRDLEEMVRAGDFREDLFYRLNVVNLEIPPLRKRQDDVPELIRFMIDKHGSKLKSRVSFSPEAFQRLVQYRWPGNVRELENVVVRILSLFTEDTVKVEDLPPAFQTLSSVPSAPVSNDVPLTFEAYEKLVIERALVHCDGNIIEAAKLLGVGKSTLYRKISTLEIDVSEVRN